MRTICLLLGCSFLLFVPAHAGHKPPAIFLRVFVQTSGEGLPPTEATTISLPPSGETIQIRTLPELTENDLIAVQSEASGAVHLLFSDHGRIALSAFTGQNQGHIMVVMVNGYIVYAPVIDEQITTGELVIPHSLNAEAIKLLQDKAQKNVTEHART